MKKRISILLVILWMLLIFIMSSANGAQSDNQSGFIVNIISNLFNISSLEILNHIIRKIAHLTEYLILGLLVHNLIKQYNKKWYISLIICILYAISDELHQGFTPGRSPQILDVFIDTIGSITGISLLHFIIKLKKIKNK